MYTLCEKEHIKEVGYGEEEFLVHILYRKSEGTHKKDEITKKINNKNFSLIAGRIISLENFLEMIKEYCKKVKEENNSSKEEDDISLMKKEIELLEKYDKDRIKADLKESYGENYGSRERYYARVNIKNIIMNSQNKEKVSAKKE